MPSKPFGVERELLPGVERDKITYTCRENPAGGWGCECRYAGTIVGYLEIEPGTERAVAKRAADEYTEMQAYLALTRGTAFEDLP